MIFETSVIINAPIDKVIATFKDESALRFWQDDFVGFERMEGQPWQIGAKKKLRYKKVELIETVLESNLPNAFKGLYEFSAGSNTMKSEFKVIDNQTTQYNASIEYIEFKGFIMKMMKLLFPSVFKKQTQKWLDQFKNHIEQQE